MLMVERGYIFFWWILKQNWKGKKGPLPAARTHTASHLPTASPGQEHRAGADPQEPSPLPFLLEEASSEGGQC